MLCMSDEIGVIFGRLRCGAESGCGIFVVPILLLAVALIFHVRVRS